MVSALHSSRPGGSKNFCKNKINFGWETIMAMWERDLERTNPTTGRLLTQLPEMRERYIYRDNWTRLNVKPAKIMQVICIIVCLCMHVCLHMEAIRIMHVFFFDVQQDRVLEELAGHCAGMHISSTDRDKLTLCYLQ